MKLISVITFSLLVSSFGFAQKDAESTHTSSKESTKVTFDKTDLVGTWRACGDVNWDENADTLVFQHPTPECRNNECGEHNWIFRETGSIEFVFTNGCDTGFHSVSKNPKRWLFVKKDNRIKMVTNDGYVEYFDIIKLDEKLVLVHRKDLEQG